MNIKTTLIASFVSGLCMFPAMSQAADALDPPELAKAILEYCETLSGEATTQRCFGACVAAQRACRVEEPTPNPAPVSVGCEKALEHVVAACTTTSEPLASR